MKKLAMGVTVILMWWKSYRIRFGTLTLLLILMITFCTGGCCWLRGTPPCEVSSNSELQDLSRNCDSLYWSYALELPDTVSTLRAISALDSLTQIENHKECNKEFAGMLNNLKLNYIRDLELRRARKWDSALVEINLPVLKSHLRVLTDYCLSK